MKENWENCKKVLKKTVQKLLFASRNAPIAKNVWKPFWKKYAPIMLVVLNQYPQEFLNNVKSTATNKEWLTTHT